MRPQGAPLTWRAQAPVPSLAWFSSYALKHKCVHILNPGPGAVIPTPGPRWAHPRLGQGQPLL